jgi:hypothetical protein
MLNQNKSDRFLSHTRLFRDPKFERPDTSLHLTASFTSNKESGFQNAQYLLRRITTETKEGKEELQYICNPKKLFRKGDANQRWSIFLDDTDLELT